MTSNDDTPQVPEDPRIDFGRPAEGTSPYLTGIVHDFNGPVVVVSTRAPDYYRSPVGTEEHRAAYRQMHASAHGAGFADPEDPDLSYEMDNAAELAADRDEEPEPDEPEGDDPDDPEGDEPGEGDPGDPMPPMPGRDATDAEVATWEAWAQRQGQREWAADRAADADRLAEQARLEDADLAGPDRDIW